MRSHIDIGEKKRRQRRLRLKLFQGLVVIILAAIAMIPSYLLLKKRYIAQAKEINKAAATKQETTTANVDGNEEITTLAGDKSAQIVTNTEMAGPYMYLCTPTPEGGKKPEGAAKSADQEEFMPDFVDTRKRTVVKGVYMTSDGATKNLDNILEMIDNTELNAIYVDIKDDDGRITCEMHGEYIDKYGTSRNFIPDINAFVKKCKEHNVYLIARVVCFKDPLLAKNAPELAIHHEDGTIYTDYSNIKWVNPGKKEVCDYLIEVAKNCYELGFDEVNFDYMRFPTDGTISDFDLGVEKDERTKIELVSAAMKYMCEEIKPIGIMVSGDVFGTVISSSIDQKYVGQDFAQLCRYLDYICPMVYPSHYGDGSYRIDYPDTEPYKLILASMLDAKNVLSVIPDDGSVNKAEVRPWLQDFTASWVRHHITYGPKEIRDQINATYDAGYQGWSLWNAAMRYTVSGLYTEEYANEEYKNRPTPTPTPTPTPAATPTKDPNRGEYIDSPWKAYKETEENR